MRREKKHEDAPHLPAQGAKGIPLWLSGGVLAVILAVLLVFAYSLPSAGGAQEKGEITLSLQSGTPIYEGRQILLKGYSSCGDFELRVDGKKLLDASSVAQISFSLAAGSHVIAASNSECSSSLPLTVLSPSCLDGQVQNCELDGCAGEQICYGGTWSPCERPPRKCPHGAKIGCAYDACSFGYATCNACGSEWGPCLPEGQNGSPLTGNAFC